MTVSPAASCGASASMTPSTAAAGIMIQIVRGGGSRLDELARATPRRRSRRRATPPRRRDRARNRRTRGRPSSQPARHVRAHPAEPDEAELHETAPVEVVESLCHNSRSQNSVARRSVIDRGGESRGTHELDLACDGGGARRDDAGLRRCSRSRGRARAHDFSAERLVAPPTDSWPTNGGNLYNQRYSPLNQIDTSNVAAAQRRLAHALARLRRRAAVLGRGAARRARRRRLRQHGRERRVRVVDRHRRDPLAIHGESSGRPAVGLLRLEQSRRGHQRGQGLHGTARRQARGSRSRRPAHPYGRFRPSDPKENFSITPAPVYYDGLRHHGLRGCRPRHARPRQSLRRRRRPAASGRSTRFRDPASRATRRGRRTTMPGSTAARPFGRRRRSTRSSGSSTSRRATRAPTTTAPCAPATISTRCRSSRSSSRRESTAGTSSRCITTSGTTTRAIPSC